MQRIKGKISVIVPAYNEGPHIAANLKEVVRTFNDFGCHYEIICIDDGSRDDTYRQFKLLADEHKEIRVRRNMRNYGKGRALKKGVRAAVGDYIVFLDADMDLHPGQIQTFFDIMRLDEADVVIGSKMHPNSKVSYPLSRKIISTVYFWLIRLFFGLPIRDSQTGLKLFKAEVVKTIFPKILVKKFAYDIELLLNAHRAGYKIIEAPVVLDSQRTYGRIGWRDIIATWQDTMAIWYRVNVLRWYEESEKKKKRIKQRQQQYSRQARKYKKKR